MQKLGEQGKGDILIREISDVKDRNPNQLQKNYGLSKSGPGCFMYWLSNVEKQITPTLGDLILPTLIISQFLKARIWVAA